jgi:hypothetical protein
MKCGLLSDQRIINNRYGFLSIWIREKQSAYMSEAGIAKAQNACGIGVYRQCAVGFTDFQSAYEAISPSERHEAVVKDSGKTNHIERFNLTSIKSGRQNDKNHAKAK